MVILGETQQRENKMAELAESLIDLAISRYHDNQSEDTFEECHMCEKFEDHTDDCPIPLLKKWLNGGKDSA